MNVWSCMAVIFLGGVVSFVGLVLLAIALAYVPIMENIPAFFERCSRFLQLELVKRWFHVMGFVYVCYGYWILNDSMKLTGAIAASIPHVVYLLASFLQFAAWCRYVGRHSLKNQKFKKALYRGWDNNFEINDGNRDPALM